MKPSVRYVIEVTKRIKMVTHASAHPSRSCWTFQIKVSIIYYMCHHAVVLFKAYLLWPGRCVKKLIGGSHLYFIPGILTLSGKYTVQCFQYIRISVTTLAISNLEIVREVCNFQ